MSEKEYIVSLNKGADYAAFNAEMIASTGTGAIPSRDVDVANARPASQRNTHYNLTDAEAEALKVDDRVYGVTLLPELDDTIGIGFDTTQTGDFSKTTLDRGNFLNWGMRRMNEDTNPYNGVNVTGGYNFTLDATGVDVVIMDSGLQIDHPEFTDTNGASRVQQIDWTTASGIAGMPAQNANYYRDYDGHGTHVAGTAAGKTYGWAKNAKIYSLKLAGLEGSGDSGTGTSATYAFDCIKEWHNAKPNDPATGVKRPTVVNMSWGYLRYYDTVTSMTYRGVSKTGTEINSSSKRWAFGLPPNWNGSRYRTNVRIASVDVDMEELIDAGVHVMVAAGNRSHKVDVEGGDDYDNLLVANTGSVNYQRGSSPYSVNAHIVGNIDSSIHSGGLEQKASSSETGPGVSTYAPGTDIMSAMSTTNAFGATVSNNPYPSNASFLINNISGTSMASPQVAGMLSLWLQINPDATPAQGLSFVNATSKTSQIYDTVSTVDYTDTRSLLGSENRFSFNKFNSNVQMRIGNPVVEESVQAATYSLSSSSASVNEGGSFVVTLTTTNVVDGTAVPYTITGVNSNDIDGANLSSSFTVNSNTATVTFNVTADATTEGVETFLLSLNALSVTQSVTINDTSTTPVATYAVAPAANNVDEGSDLVFNVTTTNVADATTLYYTLSNAGDFSTSTGSFTITSNAGSFTVTPTADSTTEGAETFIASVRTVSVGGSVVTTSSAVTINDTSTTPAGPSYVTLTAPANANEGDSVTFNISTLNVVDATTVPYTISGVSSADIGGASLTGNIAITGNAGSFTVTLTEDASTEGDEIMTLTLGATDSAGDATGGLSTSTQIGDTSTSSFTTRTVTVASGTNIYGTGNRYYIAEVAGVSPALSLSEGTTYRFDQSDSSNATHQLLFSTTPNGTHGGGTEYTTGVTKVGTAGQAGAYTQITVAAGAPALHYYCINHSGMGGTANAAAAYTFDATPAANNVNEGSTLTVNVATANVADTTTLYWTATNSGDFSTSTGSFTVTSNTGSFTVTPTADATTEGSETFQVQIRIGSTSGTVVNTSDAITINDTSTTPAFTPDYTITVTNSGNNYNLSGTDRNGAVSGANPALAFNSGDNVRFNVNASTSSAHPFYIKTTQSTGTGNQVSGATGNGTTQVDWTTNTDGAGSYGYQCSIHFGMWNTITIS